MGLETNRRNFLKLLGIGTALAVAPPILLQPIIEEEVELSPSLSEGLGFNVWHTGKWYDVGEVTNIELPIRDVIEFDAYPRRVTTEKSTAPTIIRLQVKQDSEQAHRLHDILQDLYSEIIQGNVTKLPAQISLEIEKQKFTIESSNTLITNVSDMDLFESYAFRSVEILADTFILT